MNCYCSVIKGIFSLNSRVDFLSRHVCSASTVIQMCLYAGVYLPSTEAVTGPQRAPLSLRAYGTEMINDRKAAAVATNDAVARR